MTGQLIQQKRIACLHASESNAAQFDDAAGRLGLSAGQLTHHARPDLLERAVKAGSLPGSVAEETADLLVELARDSDAVLLTCSTMGPAVQLAAGRTAVPILRADAALAAVAARTSGNIVVLCTIASTLESTQSLFEAAASGATVRTELVPDAWVHFQNGDGESYARAIASAADAAYEAGAEQVVLGQASMAVAVERVTRGPEPLSVPQAAMAAVIAQLN